MNMPRNVLLAGVLVLLTVLCMTASPRGASVPEGYARVVYWEKWSGYEAQAIRALVDAFNSSVGKSQRIFVEYVPIANVDVKAQITIVGGDPPDLVGLWQRNVAGFAAANALIPLHEVGDTAPIEAQTLEQYWDVCAYHGTQFAIPSTPATIALYWNRDLFADHAEQFRDAGLRPNQPPRTLAELQLASTILTNADQQGRLTRMGYLPGTAGSYDWYWNTWPIWWGGAWTDPTTGHLDVAQADVIDAHRWVQAYTRAFGFKKVLDFESGLGSFGAPDNPFLTDRVAMVRQGPWMAHLLRRFRPDMNVGVAPFPTRDGDPIGFFEMDVLAIPRGADQVEAAWVFVNWLYTADAIILPNFQKLAPWVDTDVSDASTLRLKPIEWLCWLHGKNSPLAQLPEAFVETHPNHGIDVHEFLAREARAATIPPLPNWSELLSEYRAAYGEVWISDADVESSFVRCQRQIDSLSNDCTTRFRRWGGSYP